MKPINGKIINSEFVPFAASYYKKALTALNGEEVTVSIRKKASKRSIDQNRYYWKLMTLISDETGIHSNELHEMFKAKFLAKENLLMGEAVQYYASTTKLTVKQMYEYCERIRAFMYENGIVLPDETEIDLY